ncbi:hypothetical protein SFUMM280S_03975 [Streptomyces fumanus]
MADPEHLLTVAAGDGSLERAFGNPVGTAEAVREHYVGESDLRARAWLIALAAHHRLTLTQLESLVPRLHARGIRPLTPLDHPVLTEMAAQEKEELPPYTPPAGADATGTGEPLVDLSTLDGGHLPLIGSADVTPAAHLATSWGVSRELAERVTRSTWFDQAAADRVRDELGALDGPAGERLLRWMDAIDRVPTDLAAQAREHGLSVGALYSVASSAMADPRHLLVWGEAIGGVPTDLEDLAREHGLSPHDLYFIASSMMAHPRRLLTVAARDGSLSTLQTGTQEAADRVRGDYVQRSDRRARAWLIELAAHHGLTLAQLEVLVGRLHERRMPPLTALDDPALTAMAAQVSGRTPEAGASEDTTPAYDLSTLSGAVGRPDGHDLVAPAGTAATGRAPEPAPAGPSMPRRKPVPGPAVRSQQPVPGPATPHRRPVPDPAVPRRKPVPGPAALSRRPVPDPSAPRRKPVPVPAPVATVAPPVGFRRTGPLGAEVHGTALTLHEPVDTEGGFTTALLHAVRVAAPRAVPGADTPGAFLAWAAARVTADDLADSPPPALAPPAGIPVRLLLDAGVSLTPAHRTQAVLLGDVLPVADLPLSPVERARLLLLAPSYASEEHFSLFLAALTARLLGIRITVVDRTGNVHLFGRTGAEPEDDGPGAVVVDDGQTPLFGVPVPKGSPGPRRADRS